jgi:MFS family permease
MEALSATSSLPSFLGTRRGKLTLALVSAVAFIDLLDASIVNVALPQIQTHLHSSVQSLQWVASAYLLTYGGSCCSAAARLICSAGSTRSGACTPHRGAQDQDRHRARFGRA